MLGWGFGSAQEAQAAPAVDFYIEVATAGCDTDGGSTTCNVDMGTSFMVTMNLKSFSGLPGTGGYIGFQGRLDNSAGMPYQDRPGTTEVVWPDAGFSIDTLGVDTYTGGSLTAVIPPYPVSNYTGAMMEVDYDCTAGPSAGHTITMVHGPAGLDTLLFDETSAYIMDTDPNETLTINCVAPADLQVALFSVQPPDIVIPGCEPAAVLTLPGLGIAGCPRAAPSPDLSIPPAFLGLDWFGPGTDNLDAGSFQDVIDEPSPFRHFSVDFASVGAAGCPGPDVNSEAILAEAQGDIFTDNAPPNCNAQFQDEALQGLIAPGLTPAGGRDDMDALTDLNGPWGAFSIDWASALFGIPDEYGSPMLGADLLVAPGTPPNDLFPGGCAGIGPLPGSPCV